jgi:hypothetical protein
VYKWQYATATDSTAFSDIAHDSIGYVPGTLTETTWYKRLARVSCKTDWVGAAESNKVKITVWPMEVATQAVSAIDETTATGNGNLTATNCTNASSRGVIWYPFTGTDMSIGQATVTNVSETGNFYGTADFDPGTER